MNFENMTDGDLETSLHNYVAQERKTLPVIIEHIREVDSRQLHLKRGFSSLKEYLIKEFKYSGAAADRRIEASQLMKDVPSIGEKVRNGDLNLSQIGEVHYAIKKKELISRVKISAKEKYELVESVVGLTVREAQQELSKMLDIPVKKIEKVIVQQDGSVQVTLWLSKESFENLNSSKDMCAQKLAQENQEINLSNTLEYVLAKHVETKSPSNRANKKSENDDGPRRSKSQIIAKEQTDAVPLRVNKTLTPNTRQLVFQRDGCCVFKDHKTGKVCGSTFGLQVDHIKSLRLGGDHSLSNLQTLCARHNRFKFQQEKLMELRFYA